MRSPTAWRISSRSKPGGGPSRWASGLIVLALVVAAPYLTGSAYLTGIGTIALAFVVLSCTFNLVYGYMGYLSLGQVAFWATGAYGAALAATRLGWSPWLAFIFGGIVAAALAVVVGLPALRLSRHSFAIVTLTIGLLAQLVATDWTGLTRGPLGIPGLPVPQLSLGPLSVRFGQPIPDYYLMLAVALITIVIVGRLVHCRIGRTLLAIRENEPLAASQGVNTLRYKLMAFALSGFLSGLIGGVFVFHLALVDPSIADFYYTEAVLIMVIVAGAGSFWPAVASAVVFTFVPELLQVSQDMRLVIYGGILIAAALVFPDGLAGLVRRRRMNRLRRIYTPATAPEEDESRPEGRRRDRDQSAVTS